MSSRPVIEELPSSSDDESLDFDSAEDLSGDSDDEIKRHDPLADFEKVEASAAAQSREAAVEGAPVDFTNPIDLTEPKEEVLEVEELPEEEMKKRLELAEAFKVEGNALYQDSKYTEAIEKYTQAIEAAPKNHPVCAVFLSNRAACHVSQGSWRFVVEDTTKALKLQPDYIKAVARRAQAHEELKNSEDALADLKRLLEIDPNCKRAVEPRINRLEKELEEKRKKEQEEMIGQLKDMGNKFLGMFGLSLDNFKAEQDQSGSYKINFSQN